MLVVRGNKKMKRSGTPGAKVNYTPKNLYSTVDSYGYSIPTINGHIVENELVSWFH